MKKENPYARKIILHVRVNSEEMRQLLKLAHQHSHGNISQLVRQVLLKK